MIPDCWLCKGTGKRARRGHKPVLNVEQIARWRAHGWTMRRIADKFGVSHQAVSQALKKRKNAENRNAETGT